MDFRKYSAEALGTFFLTLAVYLSLAFATPLATPIVAALTLGLFVYTVGDLSGCHINPAVTIGLWSIKKINAKDAMLYIIAQFVGAFLAMQLGLYISQGHAVVAGYEDAFSVGVSEALGAFVFTFGIASVVYAKVHSSFSGMIVGLSLLLGIFVASPMSNAVLNPAVALGIGSFGVMYILGPIVGSLAGFWAFTGLHGEKIGKRK